MEKVNLNIGKMQKQMQELTKDSGMKTTTDTAKRVLSIEADEIKPVPKTQFQLLFENVAAEINTDIDPSTGKEFMFGFMYVDKNGNFRYAFSQDIKSKALEITELTKYQLLKSYENPK